MDTGDLGLGLDGLVEGEAWSWVDVNQCGLFEGACNKGAEGRNDADTGDENALVERSDRNGAQLWDLEEQHGGVITADNDQIPWDIHVGDGPTSTTIECS